MHPATELREAGYEPLAPYPGTVAALWPARCTACGAERRPSLHDIRKGKRCAHRGVATSPEGAASEAQAAGFDPLEPYPGNRTTPWRVRCTVCDAERTPTLKSIRDGWQCKHRYTDIARNTTAEEADSELRLASYEPMESYPGKTKATWRVRCTECGARRTVTLNRVRSGERCKHRVRAKKRVGYSKRSSLPAERIINRYKAGDSLKSIAKAYDTSDNTVRRLLEEHGVDRRPSIHSLHKRTPGPGRGNMAAATMRLPAEKVISEYREGASLAALAQRYGVGVNAIARLMDSRGEERRSPQPKKGISRILDDATEEQIVRRSQQGESLRAIAASLGISKNTVSRVLTRRAVKATNPAYRPRPDLPMSEIAERHAGGESLQALAAEFGVHPDTIRRRLRDAEQRDSE